MLYAAQTMVEKVFGDIPGVLVIHDDLIIASKASDEHDKTLTKVFDRARERNIKFNKKKIQFKVSEVKYLGHIIGKTGTRPDPDKIEAIQEIPTPKNKQELQHFLGFVNYVGKFIPNLLQITTPLRNLLEKNSHWSWNYEHDAAIETNKNITTNLTLQFFDINKQAQIQVDASSHALGACLMQDNRRICYASQSLKPSEIQFAQIEKELLAIVYGCEKFNQYIYGREIIIQTDHKPLESIMKKPLANTPPRIQRLLIRLQKYQLRVQYIPGKDLIIADTLSRALHIPKQDIDLIHDIEIMVHTIVENLPVSSERLQELKSSTKTDYEL